MVRRRERRIVVLLLAGVAVVSASGAQGYSDRRLVVAFGAAGSEPMQRLERRVAEERCRLVDRDVDVRFVDTGELATLETAEKTGVETANPEPNRELLALRGSDAGPFELVLVGKDGGVKARADDPDALSSFLEEIDGMPMRRAEVRRADEKRAGGDEEACGSDASPKTD